MQARTESMTNREWYNYVLFDDDEIVYFGITMNPPDENGLHRIRQHSTDKKFTSLDVEPYPHTRESAQEIEKQRILDYAQSHNGKYPKYNKIL